MPINNSPALIRANASQRKPHRSNHSCGAYYSVARAPASPARHNLLSSLTPSLCPAPLPRDLAGLNIAAATTTTFSVPLSAILLFQLACAGQHCLQLTRSRHLLPTSRSPLHSCQSPPGQSSFLPFRLVLLPAAGPDPFHPSPDSFTYREPRPDRHKFSARQEHQPSVLARRGLSRVLSPSP